MSQRKNGRSKPPRKRKSPPKAEAPAPAEKVPVEPFKIVGQLVGVQRDGDGEIVAEVVMGELAIYKTNFGKLDEIVEQSVAEAREAGRI